MATIQSEHTNVGDGTFRFQFDLDALPLSKTYTEQEIEHMVKGLQLLERDYQGDYINTIRKLNYELQQRRR